MRLRVLAIAFPLLFPAALFAADHNHAAATADAAKADISWAEGTIRKIERAAGAVVLAHGPIESVGMAAMTMQFAVKDAASLTRFKVGDKVRFQAVMAGGEIVVVRIEAAK